MRDRRPFRLYEIGDDDYAPNRTVAVVRYDGDPDTFTALVLHWLLTERDGCGDNAVLPPQPRLFRWNPDPSRTYAFLLADANKPGPGVWLGARVEFARDTSGPVSTRFCNACDAFAGENHTGSCAYGKAIEKALAAAPAPNWPAAATLTELTQPQWSGV